MKAKKAKRSIIEQASAENEIVERVCVLCELRDDHERACAVVMKSDQPIRLMALVTDELLRKWSVQAAQRFLRNMATATE